MPGMKIGAAAAGLCFATIGLAQMPPSYPTARSIPGTVLRCTDNTQVCKVVVRVEPEGDGCRAVIDFAQVRIKKRTKIQFVLVRSSMADPDTYEFLGSGIIWLISPQPTEDQFKPAGLSAGGSVAEWTTGDRKTETDADYVPNVQRKRGSKGCGAGDPKIANDG